MKDLSIKIVEEVRKKGREYLYSLSHASYRNTCLKQNTWRTIASVVGSTPTETMKQWKALRTRYVKLNKQLKSGSAALPRNSRDEWLLRELDFLKNEIITEPTVSSFESNVKRPTLFQDLFDLTADEIIVDFGSTDFIIDETPPPTITTSPEPPTITLRQPTTSTQRMVEPTPGPSNAEAPTSPAIASQRSARRQPPSKRKKEPEDPNVTKICESILQQQQFLQTLAQPAAPAEPNNCMLKLFAETWSTDFRKWPRSMQTGFIHKITLLIEEENNQIVTQFENNFDYSL